jgi:hypothetical protein
MPEATWLAPLAMLCAAAAAVPIDRLATTSSSAYDPA